MKLYKTINSEGHAEYKLCSCEHVCYTLDRLGVLDHKCDKLIVELAGLRCRLDEEKDC